MSNVRDLGVCNRSYTLQYTLTPPRDRLYTSRDHEQDWRAVDIASLKRSQEKQAWECKAIRVTHDLMKNRGVRFHIIFYRILYAFLIDSMSY